MNCLVCRGACCEEIFIRPEDFSVPNLAVWEWWMIRTKEIEGQFVIESRCPVLSECGLCEVHGTSRQPSLCQEMRAGGPECISAVKRRRTALEYQKIRDDGDPSEIHGAVGR